MLTAIPASLPFCYDAHRPASCGRSFGISSAADPEKFRNGVELFNSRKFFEAHEVWEELWLRASGREKLFLQGLIQLAAAFHHHARGNGAGMRSLLRASLKKLEPFPETFHGIQLAALLADARPWIGAPANTRSPLPRILRHR